MKFLVIGASGFIGRHTIGLARSLSHKVIGTRSKPGDPECITFNLLSHRLSQRMDHPFFESGGKIYGIICASVRQIDQCYREHRVTRQINVEKTIQLIEDMRELDILPVFLSTSYVFDGTTGNYTENDKHCPICEYGRQKAEVESYLSSHHPDIPVLRFDKIVGDNPDEDHLFTEWHGWLKKGLPITCISGQIMSVTFVEDIAGAIMLACEKDLKGLYNTANPEFFSREELAELFLEIVGKQAEIILKHQKCFGFDDQRPLNTYIDSSKFIKATGFTFTPIRTIIESFAQKTA